MERTIGVTYANHTAYDLSLGDATFKSVEAYEAWRAVTSAEIVYVEDSHLDYPMLSPNMMEDM